MRKADLTTWKLYENKQPNHLKLQREHLQGSHTFKIATCDSLIGLEHKTYTYSIIATRHRVCLRRRVRCPSAVIRKSDLEPAGDHVPRLEDTVIDAMSTSSGLSDRYNFYCALPFSVVLRIVDKLSTNLLWQPWVDATAPEVAKKLWKKSEIWLPDEQVDGSWTRNVSGCLNRSLSCFNAAFSRWRTQLGSPIKPSNSHNGVCERGHTTEDENAWA